MAVCIKCFGAKQVRCPSHSAARCGNCGGSGMVTCPVCGGSGKTPESR